MFAANLRSETRTAETCPDALAALQSLRVSGSVRAEFIAGDGLTYAARTHEAQGWRIRIPEPVARNCEAIILNTGGGIAGGDAVKLDFRLGEKAQATVTTVAGERVYRTVGPAAHIDAKLTLAARSSLSWLPRETILSSGARLLRRIDVDMAPDATLTLLDIVVLGRRGSGERMERGLLDDRWSIQRAGRLSHMEALKLEGAIERKLARAAVAGGAHVIGTLVHLDRNAGACLDRVRRALSCHANMEIATSAWADKLVVRGLFGNSEHARSAFADVVGVLTAKPMPRAWLT